MLAVGKLRCQSEHTCCAFIGTFVVDVAIELRSEKSSCTVDKPGTANPTATTNHLGCLSMVTTVPVVVASVSVATLAEQIKILDLDQLLGGHCKGGRLSRLTNVLVCCHGGLKSSSHAQKRGAQSWWKSEETTATVVAWVVRPLGRGRPATPRVASPGVCSSYIYLFYYFCYRRNEKKRSINLGQTQVSFFFF